MQYRNPASNFGRISFDALGDGASTSITVDIENAPFALDVKGNLPTSVQVVQLDTNDPTLTASAILSRSVVTVSFNHAMPNDGSHATVGVQFVYTGI